MTRLGHTVLVTLALGLALLTVIMSSRQAAGCDRAPPTEAPGHPGMGWWQQQDCTWVRVPCAPLSAFQSDLDLARLPAGCPVLRPRIGYSVSQDAAVREDLARAGVQIPMLRAELARCRVRADVGTALVDEQLIDNTVELRTSSARVAELEAERAELLDARFWLHVRWSGVALGIGTVGFLIGLVAD